MTHYLNLIRWKNLVMIAVTQILIKYALLLPFYKSHGVITTLNPLSFFLLVLATVCIAAGGYIINDINDISTDAINKPNKVIINKNISENTAFKLFTGLNIIGLGLGFYLSNTVGKPIYFTLFFTASALLYIYASHLKQIALIGNITVASMVALALILVGVFELLPMISSSNRPVQIFFFKLILDYAIFAFMITIIREIVKDIEDVDGDYHTGMKTLPIVLGRERTTKLLFVLSLIPLFSIVYYVVVHLYKQQLFVGYFLVFVIAPLIYMTIQLFSATKKSSFKAISKILKIVMLTGMMSLLLYPYILK